MTRIRDDLEPGVNDQNHRQNHQRKEPHPPAPTPQRQRRTDDRREELRTPAARGPAKGVVAGAEADQRERQSRGQTFPTARPGVVRHRDADPHGGHADRGPAAVRFTYTSPDGEEGFPGLLRAAGFTIARIRRLLLAEALLGPDIPQVAVFDTAFHHTQPAVEQTFALPRRYAHEGVRRYGFHGLSYEYIASALPVVAPAVGVGRAVVAHLGNGASLAAILGGKSVDTTMGFTPAAGVPMSTRKEL